MVAGFNMHKWASNSRQLMDRIDSSEKEILAHCDLQMQSVLEKNKQLKANTPLKSVKELGITWNPKKDTLDFEFANVIEAAVQEQVGGIAIGKYQIYGGIAIGKYERQALSLPPKFAIFSKVKPIMGKAEV